MVDGDCMAGSFDSVPRTLNIRGMAKTALFYFEKYRIQIILYVQINADLYSFVMNKYK